MSERSETRYINGIRTSVVVQTPMRNVAGELCVAPSTAPTHTVSLATGITVDDIEWFRKNKTRNWRLRAKCQDEKSHTNASISTSFPMLLVIRPHVVPNLDGPYMHGYFFIKIEVTGGSHNDLSDPWVYFIGGALRASAVWKIVASFARIRDEGKQGDEFFQPETIVACIADASRIGSPVAGMDFANWLYADIERTVRLSRSFYDRSPVLHEAGFESFADMRLDDVEAAVEKQRDQLDVTAPDIGPKAMSALIGGWDFWQREYATIAPSRELCLAVESLIDDEPNVINTYFYEDNEPPLSFPTLLIDTHHFRAAAPAPAPIDTATPAKPHYLHGIVVTTVCAGTILRVGQLELDGRIGFWEHDLDETTTWSSLYDECDAELPRIAVYLLFLLARSRVFYSSHGLPVPNELAPGLELLSPSLPKPKEIVVTMQPVPKPPPAPNPGLAVNDLLARIQAAYEQRQQLHVARIAELRSALDGYARAAELDLTVDFAKRNGVEDAGELQAPDAALHLSVLVSELPEMGGERVTTVPAVPARWARSPVPNLAADADEDVVEAHDFDKIRLASVDNSFVVLVGGTPVKKKFPWLDSVLGYEPEWIETEDDPDAKNCAAFAKRMSHGGVCGVIFFQSFMSHPQTEALIQGGREHGIPVIAAGRAGKGTITRALKEIEARL